MIIRNRIVLILWRPGRGKTFLATFFASFYERIIANVDILDANKKTIISRISNVSDLDNMKFSIVKGCVVLDEGGLNVNARRSQSEQNQAFTERLGMLGRKLNCDIVICAQLNRMVDVYFRELADFVIEMDSYYVSNDKLMFTAKIFTAEGGTQREELKIDLFEWSKLTGFTYSSLESSRIEKRDKKKEISNFRSKIFQETFKEELIL